MGTAAEHTPLITTVKVEAAPRHRYSPPVVRRLFTLSFSSVFFWLSLLFFASFTFLPRPSSWPGCGHGRSKVDYEELRQLLLDTPDSKKAEEWQRYYTAGPHLAGKNYSQVCRSSAQVINHTLIRLVGPLDKGKVGRVRC